MGLKFLKWGKTHQVGVKVHQDITSKTVKCTLSESKSSIGIAIAAKVLKMSHDQ